MFLTVVK